MLNRVAPYRPGRGYGSVDNEPPPSSDCRSRSCCTSDAYDSWTCHRRRLRKRGWRIVSRARDLRDRADRSLTERLAPATGRARLGRGGSSPRTSRSSVRAACSLDAFPCLVDRFERFARDWPTSCEPFRKELRARRSRFDKRVPPHDRVRTSSGRAAPGFDL